MKKLCRITAAAAGLLLGYAALENTQMLRVVQYETDFPGLPRTVLLADLHKRRFGADQQKLIHQVAELHPECILIAGDLVSRTVHDFTGTASLLRRLCAIAPVIFSEGNHETDLPPSLYQAFRRTVSESGALYLHNSYAKIGGITVAGLALPASYYRGGKRFGYLGKDACTAETMQKMLGDCPPDTLLLAHNPLFFPAHSF